MKILQSIETGGPGGAEEVLIALCSGLRARGHDIEAVLLKRGWLSERLESEGVPTRILQLAGGIDRAFVSRLAETLRESGADVFHSHEFSMTWYGRRACRATGVRHVGTVHGKNFVGATKRRLAAGWSLQPHPRTTLTAVSDDLATYIAHRAIPRLRNVEVVRNGVHLPSHAEVRAREGNELRLVAVGNLYPVKNHALSIEALAEIVRRGVDARLTILGRGGEQAGLERRARELGVTERVELAGYRDDVPDFLDAADVFVSSSLSEGMPLSFLEAMGHALPIVASRVGGVPEIVEHDRHGLLFPSEDSGALADALERLARDDGLRRRLAAEALHAARALWSVDAMVARYLAVYERLGG